MTKTLFVAFSHAITEGQVGDAKMTLGIDEIVELKDTFPEQHRAMGQIPATWAAQQVKDLALEIVVSAIQMRATHLYIAGEPTLSYYAIEAAKALKLVVIQSTTERVSEEKPGPDGTMVKVSVFKHVMWRVL